MLLSFGILLILCGLGIMGFGLFIFYAWLPLFYGLLGLEIGLLLGKWLTGDVGTIAIFSASSADWRPQPRPISLSRIGASCSATGAAPS